MLQIKEGVLGYLKAILEDNNVAKVFHDCRQDSAALYYQFGIKAQPVLDTQVWLWPASSQHCTRLIASYAIPPSSIPCTGYLVWPASIACKVYARHPVQCEMHQTAAGCHDEG